MGAAVDGVCKGEAILGLELLDASAALELKWDVWLVVSRRCLIWFEESLRFGENFSGGTYLKKVENTYRTIHSGYTHTHTLHKPATTLMGVSVLEDIRYVGFI